MEIANDQEYRALVDRIVYLASLVSDQQSIDPKLDTLREVTAKWHGAPAGSTVATEDIATLRQLEAELKDHLVNRDPLRSFTPETLDQRLQSNANRSEGTDKNKRNFSLILLTSFATLIAGFLVAPSDLPALSRFVLALPIYLAIGTVGITWFYMSALQNFKPGVQRVFLYLSIGWATIGVLQLHYGAILIFDLLRYPAFKYMGIVGITTIWILFIFLGLQKYGNLLSLKTRFSSWKWIGGSTLLLALFALFAPHPTPVEHEGFFRLAMVSIAPVIPLGIATTVLAFKIRRIVTTAYRKPMTILACYLAAVTANCVGGISILFVIGTPSPTVLAAIVGSGFLPQILLLYTGYLFKKETGK